MNWRSHFSLFMSVALITVFTGCASWREPGPTIPPKAPSGGLGKWQTVWVDPQIVESGKNFTLIRADRLDSVAVERNVDYTPGNSPSLMFHIETGSCDTRIEFLDSKDRLINRMFSSRLERGHYKISLDEQGVLPGVYSLRASFCGRTAKTSFAVTK
ncbi:MAG: hypothetical protein NDJ18_08705 [candidate division Zixibacteria bacterium]|nr:hypothetical protein [candidate division Zixibacteria bacterium]